MEIELEASHSKPSKKASMKKEIIKQGLKSMQASINTVLNGSLSGRINWEPLLNTSESTEIEKIKKVLLDKLNDREKELLVLQQRSVDLELKYRYALSELHKHKARFTENGCLQCAECPTDFLQDSLEELEISNQEAVKYANQSDMSATDLFPMVDGPPISLHLAKAIHQREFYCERIALSLEEIAARGGYQWADMPWLKQELQGHTNTRVRRVIEERAAKRLFEGLPL